MKFPAAPIAALLLPILASVLGAASAQGYQFTYTNPSVGDSDAPFVLEYFSLVDCVPCREFELSELDAILPMVSSGVLRIVFRDLVPAPPVELDGIRLFCLQEHADFIAARRAAKQAGSTSHVRLQLRDKRLARWLQCIEGESVLNIMAHNQRALDQYGFSGTPSFVLSWQAHNYRRESRWSGSIEASVIIATITSVTPGTPGTPALSEVATAPNEPVRKIRSIQ